jgi:hypothetical protein
VKAPAGGGQLLIQPLVGVGRWRCAHGGQGGIGVHQEVRIFDIFRRSGSSCLWWAIAS